MQFPADLVTFTHEILNRELHVLYNEKTVKNARILILLTTGFMLTFVYSIMQSGICANKIKDRIFTARLIFLCFITTFSKLVKKKTLKKDICQVLKY